MDSKTRKIFLAVSLVGFMAVSSLSFTSYQQLRASGQVAGKFQSSGFNAKTSVTPKAGWPWDVVNKLLKFIKKY